VKVFYLLQQAYKWGFFATLKFLYHEVLLIFQNRNELIFISNEELYSEIKDFVNFKSTDITSHGPVPIPVINESFKELPNHIFHYSLVDFGSGSGRVLVEALKNGFNKVYGYEISKNLYEVSVKNITDQNLDKNTIIYNKNFLDWKYEEGQRVFFIYNTSSKEVMEILIGNLKQKYIELGLNFWIIYVTPEQDEIFQSEYFDKIFSKVNRQGTGFCIYKFIPLHQNKIQQDNDE
tara:strand:- start:439 stop:1140 length:702 start_codon:yes stop_codon:yes gene_type:complete